MTVFSALNIPVYAIDADINAECAVVLNADTNELIYSKNPFTQKSMASTTKIMTSLIAVESGLLLNEVTVTDEIHSEGSSIGLKKGDILSLENLVYAMMLESGNDAAEVTAEYFSGNEERFADLMNAKARSIGMNYTNFVTASGLDSDEHYSTAYDMALLGAYAVKNPVFRKFCATETKTIDFIEPQYKTTFSNHNKLLKYCDGVFGIKTGFTKKSGRCLVTACERDGIILVAVTLNAPNDWNDHEKLYKICYDSLNVTPFDLYFNREIAVYGSEIYSVSVASQEKIYNYSTLSDNKAVTKILLPDFLYAPIKKGDILGEIQVVSDDKIIYSTPLIAGENAESIKGEAVKKYSLIEKIRHFLLKGRFK